MISGRSEKGILYGRIMSARHSLIQEKDEKEPGSIRGNDFLQLQAVNVRYMENAISSLSCETEFSLHLYNRENWRTYTILTCQWTFTRVTKYLTSEERQRCQQEDAGQGWLGEYFSLKLPNGR